MKNSVSLTLRAALIITGMTVLWQSARRSFAGQLSPIDSCKIHALPGQMDFDPERALMECMDLAKVGDAEAAWTVCGLYALGFIGNDQNLEQASLWCKTAGDHGHAAASRQYANMLLDGLGVPQDSALALEWMQRAANYGDTIASVDLGIIQEAIGKNRFTTSKLYFDGAQRYLHAEPPMPIPALKWMQRSADFGYDVAQLIFGQMLLEGVGLPAPQPRMAASYLSKAVMQGNAEAMYYLAVLVLDNSEDWNEISKAVRLLSSAADRKIPQAMALYGQMLQDGNRVQRDVPAGTNFIKQAAEQGLERAMLLYGSSLYIGRGVAQDRELAVSWVGRAAEANLVEAQAVLGRIYKEDAALRNTELAKHWLERAANAGSTDADILLGEIQEDSTAGSVDNEAARDWFLKAAESGSSQAALALATNYKRTIPGHLGVRSAYKWANIAASLFPNNDVVTEARKLRENLSSSIGLEEQYELALEGFNWLQVNAPERYSEALTIKY